ncbi:MAG: SPASM domain-containing protein, partial [Holophagales bacterium]|nr:SPASM domain-containing protein [Holophagales bacterium]
ATELDAFGDLLGPEGLGQVQVTIDGPPAEHDRRRIYPDGGGSYSRIGRNIDLALERGTRVSVRLNLDRNNLATLPALADDFVARGWVDRPGFSAYTAPINASNDKTDAATTFDSWQLDRALTEMRRTHPSLRHIGRPDEGIRIRAQQLFGGQQELVPQLRPSFCGAHDQMYIFDPFGDIYACWERTGDQNIRIGHVEPAGRVSLRFELHREWRSRSVASNPVCQRCRYALHCGGGCAVLALGSRGKFHANFCDGFASRFRASIAEAYAAHTRGDLPARPADRVCDL